MIEVQFSSFQRVIQHLLWVSGPSEPSVSAKIMLESGVVRTRTPTLESYAIAQNKEDTFFFTLWL